MRTLLIARACLVVLKRDKWASTVNQNLDKRIHLQGEQCDLVCPIGMMRHPLEPMRLVADCHPNIDSDNFKTVA